MIKGLNVRANILRANTDYLYDSKSRNHEGKKRMGREKYDEYILKVSHTRKEILVTRIGKIFLFRI